MGDSNSRKKSSPDHSSSKPNPKKQNKGNPQGILKKTPGFPTPVHSTTAQHLGKVIPVSPNSTEKYPSSAQDHSLRAAHFDEMNIIATLHPAEKDYGHMKVTEPDTPYNYDYRASDAEVALDAQRVLNELEKLTKLTLNGGDKRKAAAPISEDDTPSEDVLTEEERKKLDDFKNKRKGHYNEYQAVLAMKNQQRKDEDDDDSSSSSAATGKERTKT